MAPDTLEIRSIHPLLRAYTVLAWAGFGSLMLALAVRFPTQGHVFGYLFGAAGLWVALYWWRVPEVRVTLRPDGIDYVDTSLGALMSFPIRRASWSDIVAVDTRNVTYRHGSFVRTRVTVRDGALRIRRFTVTSRDDGYGRLLDTLAGHMAGAGVEMRGPRSARVYDEMREMLGGQLKLIGGFALVAGALLTFAWLTRR
ncbi:MAG: hypothetical protein ACHQ52_01725 [Candidatus Eisenbacteria bacterium]